MRTNILRKNVSPVWNYEVLLCESIWLECLTGNSGRRKLNPGLPYSLCRCKGLLIPLGGHLVDFSGFLRVNFTSLVQPEVPRVRNLHWRFHVGFSNMIAVSVLGATSLSPDMDILFEVGRNSGRACRVTWCITDTNDSRL